MEQDLEFLSSLFPALSAQLRMTLQNLQLSAARLAPAEAREQDPVLDEEAARLDRSYYQLLRLTNDLTAAAWLSQKKQLQLRNVDLCELLHTLFASAESLAALKGLTLSLRCPMEHCVTAVDREALEQALYQLLSNAFKFTPAGGSITLELKKIPGSVQLIVSDTGCGIPADKLPALFSRCIDPEALTDLPQQGLGLGLLLCRSIAQAHGGSVLADSKEGEGSRFLLTLPDRTCDAGLSDVDFTYSGGFNRALMHLADVLPVEAFRVRNQ